MYIQISGETHKPMPLVEFKHMTPGLQVLSRLQLISCSTVLLEKLIVAQLVKKFP
jgi:hypothetical protein